MVGLSSDLETLFTIFDKPIPIYRFEGIYKEQIFKILNVLFSLTSKVYSITSYIHEHYKENLSLDFLAKQFYISSYYLSHQFKKITGFTLINYIQMTRIRNAQQLLLSSDKMKVTAISNSCGFVSFSQLNRTFNKYCGTSPSKFRATKGSKTMLSFTRLE